MPERDIQTFNSFAPSADLFPCVFLAKQCGLDNLHVRSRDIEYQDGGRKTGCGYYRFDLANTPPKCG